MGKCVAAARDDGDDGASVTVPGVSNDDARGIWEGARHGSWCCAGGVDALDDPGRDRPGWFVSERERLGGVELSYGQV